jgi:uncharacterized membrane protein
VYPQLDGETSSAETTRNDPDTPREAVRVVVHEGHSQVVLAVDLESLVAEARRCGGIIEIVPQVGDFVATNDPLFQLHGGAAGFDDAVLREAIAMGPERTMEQDPMLAFRILVDVGLWAL